MLAKSIIMVGACFVAIRPARADWNALPAVTGGGACRAMAFADESHGYMIVDKGTVGDVFVTSDGGQTFAKVPSTSLPVKDWSRISAVNASVAFVSARGLGADKQVIAKTVDGGANWALQTVTTANAAAGYVRLEQIAFVDAMNGYAGGTQDETGTGTSIDTAAIYRTTDGGSTWVQTGVPAAAGKTVVVLAFTAAATGISVSNGPSQASIERTTNSGASWAVVHTAAGDVQAIQFVDATNGFGFTDTELLSTTNAGANWTLSATAPPAPLFNGESFLDSQAGLVNSNDGATSPWIWRTQSGGTSWQPETTPTGWLGGVGCLAYASATTQFAASSDAAETRPLKFTPAGMTDAGAGNADAALGADGGSNHDAGTNPDNDGAQGCACDVDPHGGHGG